MFRVRVLDFNSFDDGYVIQTRINNAIEKLEEEDLTVDYVEYFCNRDGHLTEVVIEYSDCK